MSPETKQDYLDKLKRFLATPHSTKAYFDEYHQEHQEATFDDYTKKIEDLLDELDDERIDEQDQLCQHIKSLKLPHNQFGCGA